MRVGESGPAEREIGGSEFDGQWMEGAAGRCVEATARGYWIGNGTRG